MTILKIEPTIVDSSSMETALSTIRRYVAQAAQQAGLNVDQINALRLAVDEIATNIIIHGYNEAGQSGQVEVTASIDDQQLIIVLADTAAPFDPHKAPRPTDLENPLDSRKIGGLGIFLAKKNVDSFEYERDGNRNINRFCVKRLV